MKLLYTPLLVVCFVCSGGHLTAQITNLRQSVWLHDQPASDGNTHRFPVLAGDSLTLTIDLHRPRLSAKTVLSRFVPFFAVGAFGQQKTANQQDGRLVGSPPILSAGVMATLPGMLGGKGRHRNGVSVTYLSMTGELLSSEFMPIHARRRANLVLKPERSGYVDVQFISKRKAEIKAVNGIESSFSKKTTRRRPTGTALPDLNVATTEDVWEKYDRYYWNYPWIDRYGDVNYPNGYGNGSSGGGGPADPIAYDGGIPGPVIGLNPKEITCKVFKAAWENSGSFDKDGNWWGSKENAGLLTNEGIIWLPTEGVNQCTGAQEINGTNNSSLQYIDCL